ncbi:hypothetical protein DXV75_09690 [Alteromonas aestuariivivens]|uniref:MSHA biogenesis protein MshF n=1 Tax=Alteromonas aestuariivivens TaxID=1938339 RepID=A0A3D8M7M2_9ALTE|nr:hypothetical protein [Alteromonas aestuariivivens]RDV25554.1 hypothetical protein DXV75_09690 [Alteromonas aestuariivivens]
MSRKRAAKNGHLKMLMQVSLVFLLGGIMATFITRLYRVEPNMQADLLQQLGDRMESSATHAYWQWRAEGQPERIMLVHYDKQGKETDRRPVSLSHTGLPKVEPTSEGCQRLWRMLLNVPMQIDGFRIVGEYYQGELVNSEPLNAYCRYRLSVGASFDYAVTSGKVTHQPAG